LPRTTVLNANEMVDYLLGQSRRDVPRSSSYLITSPDQVKEVLSEIKRVVTSARRDQGYGDAWDGASKRYLNGQVLDGTIVSIKQFGVFVELEPGVVGLTPKAAMQRAVSKVLPRLVRGSKLKIRIRSVDEHEFRIDMEIV
jgi:small subunit ribosomal protein S1